jgi:photosystem II stability/assembly factor-like uncharacterized protein
MKRIFCILSIILLVMISCEKNSSIVPDDPVEEKSLPFENASIKIDLVTSSAPGNTRDIHFFNSLKAIAVTYNGTIFLTIDGGVTWNLKYDPPVSDQPLFQILFTDDNVGYVVGGSNSSHGSGISGGIILKTNDGGSGWSQVYKTTASEIVSISSDKSGNVYVVSNDSKGRILRSSDSGLSWKEIDSTSFFLNKIIFKDNTGFCTGMKGNIFRSNEAGTSWNVIKTLDALYVTDIKFINNTGYCMANNANVYKTVDDGETWTQMFHTECIFYGLNPLTTNNCLLFGAGGYSGGCFGTFYAGIGHTIDSGTNWTVLSFKDIPSILSFDFYSATEGYAIGGFNKGSLLKIRLKI